jgi:tetratricopeptide (TPR) repeat protein
LISTLKQAGYYSKPDYNFDEGYEEIATGDSSVRFVHRGLETERRSCPYAGTPAPEVHEIGFPDVRSGWDLILYGCGVPFWTHSKGDSARRFADAWFVLAHGGSADPAQDPEFQDAVQRYRGAAGHLPISEESRAHRVAAAEAVKEKRFEDAVSEYGEALKLAPWWPQGHFNRALILAEMGAYGAATRGMKRYLALEPGAENARQVQDKIYGWQAKVK